MRFISFERSGRSMLGVREGEHVRVIGEVSLETLLAQCVDLTTYARAHAGDERLAIDGLKLLPPLSRPPKTAPKEPPSAPRSCAAQANGSASRSRPWSAPWIWRRSCSAAPSNFSMVLLPRPPSRPSAVERWPSSMAI